MVPIKVLAVGIKSAIVYLLQSIVNTCDMKKLNTLSGNADDSLAIYAEFLARCRKVMGPIDLEKLAYDRNYKAEFFCRVKLREDDQLFQLAAQVDRKLNEEIFGVHLNP